MGAFVGVALRALRSAVILLAVSTAGCGVTTGGDDAASDVGILGGTVGPTGTGGVAQTGGGGTGGASGLRR